MRKVVLLLALFALPVFPQRDTRIPLPPAPAKFVTDAAGVIPDDRELALNERLAEFERTSTHQVIVYIDRNVPEGTTLEEMGAEAIRTWGVGQVKRDNGAILFLFIDSHDSRIEVGYGLEGTLTDAMSKRILVNMRPLLRNGDYAGAVEQGAEEIIRTITAEPPAQAPPQRLRRLSERFHRAAIPRPLPAPQ
ncbi:MAG: TPM domain-containing protein [Thermoanaerobaculia bacterium]